MNYIIDTDGKPRLEPDIITWARWFEDSKNRIVAHDDIGGVRVSTVFLGIDHNFGLGGPPILWETMIFGGEHHEYQERYSSKEAAIEGHARAVGMVKPPAPAGGKGCE